MSAAEKYKPLIDELTKVVNATELELRSLAAIQQLVAELDAASKKKVKKQVTPGFEKFWAAWPTNSRKVNKQGCLTKWLAAGLECRASEIVEHVEACKIGRDWVKDSGAFIPAPLVYLNQERYLAPPPPPPNQAGSLANIKYSKDAFDNHGHLY